MRIIKVSDQFNAEEIAKIEAHYEAKFVCDTTVRSADGGWRNYPVSVFYQPDPAKVPEGGSQYFGIYFESQGPGVPMRAMICNAISATEPFEGVLAHNGDIVYSTHRHGPRTSPDGTAYADGGRDYMRRNLDATTIMLAIKDGELVIHDESQQAAE